MEPATDKTRVLQNISRLAKSQKNLPIPADIEVEEAFTALASPFNEPNVAIVIDERKLYIQKEQLVVVSPVFKEMFSSKFIEGSKKEITLPGKNLHHFVHFLRYLCPGFDDKLTEDTVHLMLPLADEYQTDDLKKRIEKFLVNSVLRRLKFISSEQIILDIIEAERYKLSNYLDACIQVASLKMYDNLTKSPKFKEISQNTQLKISFRRWEDMDTIYKKATTRGTVYRSSYQHDSHLEDLIEQLKPHMQEN